MKVRAEAMQEASEAVPSGMLSVLGQPQSKFTAACVDAQEHCRSLGIEDPVCEVSNYLFPHCRVISGHLEVGVVGEPLSDPNPAGRWGQRYAPPEPCSAVSVTSSRDTQATQSFCCQREAHVQWALGRAVAGTAQHWEPLEWAPKG